MKHLLTLLTLSAIIVTGCGGGSETGAAECYREEHAETNAVYYWKTVFRLDSAGHEFVDRHGIGRIYLRMFDVSADAYDDSPENRTIPNASVKIDDDMYRELTEAGGNREFVPVVYITLEALKAMNGHEYVLASNIVTRVRNMCEYNGLTNVAELQLDCDWTTSTEESFFNLCKQVRYCIGELELPWKLSSTIRLHQLSRQVPPVDRGVLMVYNTGTFNDPDAANSIIDPDDVSPYLKYLPGYRLHLDVAYPTYSWQLLFRKRRFIGLTNGLDLNDTSRFESKNATQYMALRDIPHNGTIIRKGDIVRAEVSRYDDVLKVKRSIEQQLAGRPHSNILYHLDSKNLSNYTHDEIQTLFAVGR